MLNKKLQKVCVKVFGNKISDTRAGGLWSDIILYSLRHSGAIHLRIIASKNGKISLDTLRQRGGWADFTMLNYYTKFIGLDGDIEKEDLIIQEDKTQIEKEIALIKKERKEEREELKELKERFDIAFNLLPSKWEKVMVAVGEKQKKD